MRLNKSSFKLIYVILSVFIFYSCDLLPTTGEIKGNPDLSIPVEINENDIIDDDVFEEIKKSAYEANEHIKVMRYTDYKLSGGSIQAFLFQYMEDIPFDIDEKLEEAGVDRLNNIQDEIDIDPDDINVEIELNDFKNLDDGMEITTSAPIDTVISSIVSSVNSGFSSVTGTGNAGSIINVTIPFPAGTPDPLINFDVHMTGFDDVTFYNDKIYITLVMTGSDFTGLNLTFDKIKITDGETEILGQITGNTPITFNQTVQNRVIEFDLSDKTLKKDFSINIGKPIVNTAPQAKTVSFTAEVAPVNFTKIRGVSGFELLTDLFFEIDDEDGMQMNLSQSEFVHAEIKDGFIKFDFPPVTAKGTPPAKSWISGVDLITDLILRQAPDASNNTSYYNGAPWQGLDIPLVIDCDDKNIKNDLKNKHLNSNDVKLLGSGGSTGKITIEAGNKLSFKLNDDDVNSEELTIIITPIIELNEFSKLHAKVGNLAAMPSPAPVSLGASAEFVKRIYFDEIGVWLTFKEVDIEGLTMEMRILSPQKPGVTLIKTGFKPLLPGSTAKISVKDYFDITADQNGDFDLEFEFELRLNGNPLDNVDIIEMTNYDLKKTSLLIKIDETADYDGIEIKFDWSKAIVDLSSMDDLPFSDSFPKEGEDKINLQEMMGDYAEGFLFNDVTANLYIGLPGRFSELKPEVEVRAFDGDSREIDIIHKDYIDNNGYLKLPGSYSFEDLDRNDSGIFSALEPLPLNGIPLTVNNILNNPPGDLRLNYNVKVNEIEITPPMLVKDGEVVFQIAAVLIAPMTLTAGQDGAVIKIPDIFDSDADFLEREEAGKSLIPDLGDDVTLTINSLTMNVIVHDVFTGGEIYLRRTGEIPGKERLKFPISSTSVNIKIDKEFIDYLNSAEGFPYCIEEAGIRFSKGDSLRIPPSMRVNVSFSADFSITFLIPEF